MVSADFTVVTPTTSTPPEGWWNPIDQDAIEEIETSLLGIEMWADCVAYFDDPTESRESRLRSTLSEVIASPIANELGLIDDADLVAVCDGASSVADFPIEVTDGRRATEVKEVIIDLMESCVEFYAVPEDPLGYRIAINFIEMIYLLEQDPPRWPRRNLWGVREWCDVLVQGAVAS